MKTRDLVYVAIYVALALALRKLMDEKKLLVNPLKGMVAAISCGICNGECVLDVDYEEDSTAEVDMNFVLTDDNKIVEIQGTAEGKPFDENQFNQLFALARKGVAELIEKQKQALGK